MSRGQCLTLNKLLLLMLFWSLSPTTKVILSLFMLLVVMERLFFVTLLLLRLGEENKWYCVQHHLELLLFCQIEEEYLIHFICASRFLFLLMRTLWLDSNRIVIYFQSFNRPRLLFGMKFLCSTSMTLMLLINV